ncbi:homoserine dehydrogenase, NAD binding domain [Variibacter gotjawalensis]|uniref:Homoserine dehydrogenase, NAD binding domain n=1 Tax=Variibacter gotjawalensis TaxID=1333996 RepID=A0A0S3PQ47_9BRAD|nr:Gfo/Idh/MocA family oxidoreductase [Variibacter gotjawalensis]NIK48311.1 putative homoserine dehydrogenase-like protein [Variibacter gotjawalensis]RZS50183.1 putative homoserine dehydrogenase-like protein [Variibacter gotjawalensis]BAT58013.1 homoserine dehydrogenase, NAD binding domain [Variibacter gotjawalensis]
MNLSHLLMARESAGRPVTVGLIGAGKFGTMFLSQARLTKGIHVVGIADLNVERAHAQLRGAGWPNAQYDVTSLDDAIAQRKTFVSDNAAALIADPRVEVIVEATGVPSAGIAHALDAFRNGKHVVMVNVEADALAGPLLAQRAQAAGVVYSMAWGDQPALICEHIDWARTCGFKVISAGKGTRYEPHYHASNPSTVWDILDKYLKITDRNSINPKMFNSFIDGTKSGIEMTAVCNATGLSPQSGGLAFPPASRFELADICKPKSDGGTLEREGVTEVVSSVTRDGKDVPHHLAMGTYVVFEGETEYARRCFSEYHLLPDQSGRFAALYRPVHMIGLELGVSVASAALRKEPTGVATGFRSDVVATTKRALKAGEFLDGEGGYCVWGKQASAQRSLDGGLLPLGLAHNVKLKRDVVEGEELKWTDVEYDANDMAVRFRREMEEVFRPR